jgi:hypothetical protein
MSSFLPQLNKSIIPEVGSGSDQFQIKVIDSSLLNLDEA